MLGASRYCSWWPAIIAGLAALPICCGEPFGEGESSEGGATSSSSSGNGGDGGDGGSAGTTTTSSGGAGGPSGAPLGTACVADPECASGHCVDEVCCDEECNGKCETCRISELGGVGLDGTCAPIPWGDDPDNECRQMCQEDLLLVGSCNGVDGCQWQQQEPCFPYTCNGSDSVCYTSCDYEVHCAAAATCNTSSHVCEAS